MEESLEIKFPHLDHVPSHLLIYGFSTHTKSLADSSHGPYHARSAWNTDAIDYLGVVMMALNLHEVAAQNLQLSQCDGQGHIHTKKLNEIVAKVQHHRDHWKCMSFD